MDDGRQLDDLIRELKNSTSRLDQLKHLTRAWRLVRGLSPRQRMEVAAHLGIEEGMPLLESMGKSGGLSPATLAQAVAKAEKADPAELHDILRRLANPNSRIELARRALKGIKEAVADEFKNWAESPPGTGQPTLGSLLAAGEESPPPAAPSSKPVPPIPLTPPTPAPEPVAPKVEAKVETKVEAPPPKPPVVEKAPEPKPAAPISAPPVKPAEPDSRWAAPLQPVREPEPPPPREESPKKSLTARFRRLNRLLKAGPLPPGKLDSLLADFPEGWPRRRALTAAIRSGAVEDVQLLLDQIARLERPGDEFWCLSTLVHAHDLSLVEMEEAKRRVRAPASQRLLRRLQK